MSKMICYRTDLRDLEDGQTITSPGDHKAQLDDALTQAEMMLRAVSEQKAKLRADSIYAFMDEVWSKKYFLGKKGFLYQLEVDDADILHIADMMLVNRISEAPDLASAAALVKQYWSGDRGTGERVEILATRAVVTKRLYTPSDKVLLKQQLYK